MKELWIGYRTMKTILSMNLGNFGSTGKIMSGIGEIAQKHGCIFYQAYPRHKNNQLTKPNDIIICSDFVNRLNQKLAYYTGLNGCFAGLSTIRVLRKIDAIKPDIIHLHNLHNSYINLPLLFNYIKKHNIKTVWTLHDCWAFTGQCPYFTMVKCERWKTGCHDCQQYRQYPESRVDRTKTMWRLKKKWFTGVEDMTIVTPSEWLADLVKESYLKDYPVRVINNGIDLDVFKPSDNSLRVQHNIPTNKFILLGVSFGWGKRKGLDVFVELANRLDRDKYQIVLVGTDEKVDKFLPPSIISIHRTQNQKELAEIYTAADLFVNPTREENYPTVNMEALACGTPVLTFKTGGSPEIIDETCGSVVPYDDIDALESEIRRICEIKPYTQTACLEKAKNFDKNEKFKEYVELYAEMRF